MLLIVLIKDYILSPPFIYSLLTFPFCKSTTKTEFLNETAFLWLPFKIPLKFLQVDCDWFY